MKARPSIPELMLEFTRHPNPGYFALLNGQGAKAVHRALSESSEEMSRAADSWPKFLEGRFEEDTRLFQALADQPDARSASEAQMAFMKRAIHDYSDQFAFLCEQTSKAMAAWVEAMSEEMDRSAESAPQIGVAGESTDRDRDAA